MGLDQFIPPLEDVDSREADSPWTKLLANLGGYRNWQNNAEICTKLFNKLSHFNTEYANRVVHIEEVVMTEHANRAEHIDVVMYSLSRGYWLMKAAMEWENPYAGKKPTSGQSISVLRGLQWRLVMAYNAFELVCIALMQPNRTLSPEIIGKFVEKFQLRLDTNAISPPSKDRAVLRKWLSSSVVSETATFVKRKKLDEVEEELTIPTYVDSPETEGKELIEFLGLRGGDLKAFESWVLAESPVNEWDQRILLAKALRNMSAHGALSASKVGELGFRQAFEVLPANLSNVVHATLHQLL